MTYDPENPPPLAVTGFAATPMPLDILAIQHIYGANDTFQPGNDTYMLADDGVVKTIWDAGGNDTMDASGLLFGITLDLRPGAFTSHGANSGTAIAYKHATTENFIENAIGTSFNDTIIGNDAVNTVTLHGAATQYSAVRYGNEAFVYDQVSSRDGADSIIDFESLHFAASGETVSINELATALEYTASYEDLMDALGTDAGVALQHLKQFGIYEGRQVSFDGLEYIASYGDLINVFGANAGAGAGHFIEFGRGEGRQTTFDGLEYIASYGDLIVVFGANGEAGAMHYIQYGHDEGRTEDFNPQQYLDNYADLQAVFGSDLEAVTIHYIEYGYFEGRTDDVLI